MNTPHSNGSVRQHPALAFYVLTFAISWGGIVVALTFGGILHDPAQLAKRIPVMIVAMLAGPALACIVLTGIAGAKAGYRDLLSRLMQWRAPIRLYAAALLTAPLVLMTVPLALSLGFANFVPRLLTETNKSSLLLMGSVVGAVVGFFEELGWTGFVIPKLRPRFSSFRTAVIVGVLWGMWHLPVNVLSCLTPSGALSVPSLLGTLIFSLGLLPAFRVLMVKVWDHTGSLPIAMLMHSTLTASNIILGPAGTPGMTTVTFNLILAAAMWVVAAANVVSRSKQLRAQTEGAVGTLLH